MDVSLYHAINGLAGHAAWLDWSITTIAGDLPVVLGLLLAVVWCWPGSAVERGQRQRLVVYAIAAALLGLALSQVIGHLWFRERPYVHHAAHRLLAPSGDPSFPSDHAVGAFGLAMPFVLARKRVGWLLLSLAALLALARVAAGTHYPTDVLGGALIGSGAAIVVWGLRGTVEPLVAPCFLLARRLRLA